jgi:hypothetical protein
MGAMGALKRGRSVLEELPWQPLAKLHSAKACVAPPATRAIEAAPAIAIDSFLIVTI